MGPWEDFAFYCGGDKNTGAGLEEGAAVAVGSKAGGGRPVGWWPGQGGRGRDGGSGRFLNGFLDVSRRDLPINSQ